MHAFITVCSSCCSDDLDLVFNQVYHVVSEPTTSAMNSIMITALFAYDIIVFVIFLPIASCVTNISLCISRKNATVLRCLTFHKLYRT